MGERTAEDGVETAEVVMDQLFPSSHGDCRITRRTAVGAAAWTALAVSGPASLVGAEEAEEVNLSFEAALSRLKEGNARFVRD